MPIRMGCIRLHVAMDRSVCSLETFIDSVNLAARLPPVHGKATLSLRVLNHLVERIKLNLYRLFHLLDQNPGPDEKIVCRQKLF